MHCRHHASQLRRRHDEIAGLGAQLIAVGTGDVRYARAFIAEEEIPFPVLLDEEGEAADLAQVRKGRAMQIIGPRAMRGALGAYASGHRQKLKLGKRPTQLGATFVIGPGGVVRFAHLDSHVGDHADIDLVIAALRA